MRIMANQFLHGEQKISETLEDHKAEICMMHLNKWMLCCFLVDEYVCWGPSKWSNRYLDGQLNENAKNNEFENVT